MVCIYCGGNTQVYNSRLQKRNNHIWRRRRCQRCLAVFTTLETADLTNSLSVEVNGLPRPFLTDLLYTEVLLALQDRKDCYTAARELTDTIIHKLLESSASPVFTPSQISRVAAGVLEKFNRRAWHRYAAEHPSLQG